MSLPLRGLIKSTSSSVCTGFSGGRWCSFALSWQKSQQSARPAGPSERQHCCFASTGLCFIDWLVSSLLTHSLLLEPYWLIKFVQTVSWSTQTHSASLWVVQCRSSQPPAVCRVVLNPHIRQYLSDTQWSGRVVHIFKRNQGFLVVTDHCTGPCKCHLEWWKEGEKAGALYNVIRSCCKKHRQV